MKIENVDKYIKKELHKDSKTKTKQIIEMLFIKKMLEEKYK